jgi:cellulose synthase/poly-beta-1,6-N-acetylglucosamine synthase-like glycosyltransferase
MAIEKQRILVGIFSYNEGENLRSMYYEIKRQCQGLNCSIVLVDESDEPDSLAIVNKIMDKDKIINIQKHSKRSGKVDGYNRLYSYFINSDYEILIHFDADHLLSPFAVSKLAEAIDSGLDIATCLNVPLKGQKFFQRILYIMIEPAIIQRETGNFKLPLVGHNGAYNKKAVNLIGEIPSGGADEESYVLSKVIEGNLSYGIATEAISYFALPATLSDYIKSTKRVYGKVKAFEMRNKEAKTHTENTKEMLVNKLVYSRPPVRLVIRALLSDIVAAAFVPYIYIVRWAIMKSARVYASDTWESIGTTKVLRRD